MSRIAPIPMPPEGLVKTDNGRGTPQERAKYKWLHENCTCIVTGQTAVEACHVGDLRHGKGMARKGDYRLILPLIKPLHMHEEAGRIKFWTRVGLPDYIKLAQGLHALFEQEFDPAMSLAMAQRRVNRPAVVEMLGRLT